MGVSRPLPLFAPAIDPLALVRATASDGVTDVVAAATPVDIPHYRFAFVFRRAQELADRLVQFGNELLGVLERRDAEDLNLLQYTQEAAVLGLTRQVREAQVRAANETVTELTASRHGAELRANHYRDLIETGLTALEIEQLVALGAATASFTVSAGLKIGSAIAFGAPQVLIGPFIVGTEYGGKQIGKALDRVAAATDALAQAFLMQADLFGTAAVHQRVTQDWQLQLDVANADMAQVDHQLAAARAQVAAAEGDLAVVLREIANNQAVNAFLKDKFSNSQLYQWMSGQLAATYRRTYTLAHDLARAAERALLFERGLPEPATSLIRPAYWDTSRNGMLAGEALGADLDQLATMAQDTGGRGFEITRRVQLVDFDPLALLRLTTTGACEFTLPEAMFDRDFPGHYRRLVRTVSFTFLNADGQLVNPNATVTQLGHKTVLSADPKAVAYLLDPKGQAPDSVRADWRSNQRIALSDTADTTEGNGLFELRYDDDRYLPFEGTGAVSTWRIELGGGPANLAAAIANVVMTLRYTAEPGGPAFASAVRGMLPSYTAYRLFNLATDFPEEWALFVAGDSEQRLAVPSR
ncbi:hypothetical protein GCM10029964_062040 [Kibdelosporangium lantanae]